MHAAIERLEVVFCEMAPGDGLFFHANLLHASNQNNSPDPRWGLICCYNAARNDPYKESHQPRYTPLKKVDDGAILRVGMRGSSDTQKFLNPADDRTVDVSQNPRR